MLFRAVLIGTKATKKSRSISRALLQKRKHSSSKSDPSDPLSRDTYKGLALHGYNALSELRWSDVEMPLELNDDQLLVKVEAASVNALDVDMLNGYGKQLFESVRPLPAVLGRDFSGVVVAKGSGVWNYKLGDHVIGAPLPYAQGTFGEYCVVSEFHVAPKPNNLSHVEAAALPYASLTAMNALHDANLLQGPVSGPIAVLGATGGVGTTALQLLLALTPQSPHSPIIAVARPGSPHTARLEQLLQGRVRVVAGGPELALTTAGGPFTAIVDLAGVIETQWLPLLKEGGSFSTVRGNLIKTAQEFSHFTVGLGFGFANYLSHKHKVQQDHNITYSWSYFWPSSDKLETVAKLAEESKIKPVVDKVFNAADYLQAFEYLESGSHFGKVVLSFENLPRDE